MRTRVVIRRGWVVDEVTAYCPALPGCSATAPDEKQALEALRAKLHDYEARQALAERARRAVEELSLRVAEERARAAVAARQGRAHPAAATRPPVVEAVVWEADTDRVTRPDGDGAVPCRLPPAPSPMRPRPSIDQCISSLVHEVLLRGSLN
jgi:hypothetical protein